MGHSSDRPLVLGFMGRQRSGKSYVAGLLRQVAGSHDPAADIEFSDPIIEAANAALATGRRAYLDFRSALNAATSSLVNIPQPLLLGTNHYCTCARGQAMSCPECSLRDWLESGLPEDLQLDRDNKVEHRAVLIWLGVIMRQLIRDSVWADEVARRVLAVQSSPLVTVGGARYPKDAEVVRSVGGRIIRIIGRDESADPDPTNAQSDAVCPDIVVNNRVWDVNVTQATVAQLWRGLQSGRLQLVYGPSV